MNSEFPFIIFFMSLVIAESCKTSPLKYHIERLHQMLSNGGDLDQPEHMWRDFVS